MRVLRRRTDNLVQFASFGFLALLLAPRVPLVSAALAVLAVRTYRAGVTFDPAAGIVVRNTFGTHRIPWADFHRADIDRAGLVPIPTVVIRRHEGSPVALWSLATTSRGRRAQPKLAALLQEVHQAIAATQPTAAP
jgi:hypothetical protein